MGVADRATKTTWAGHSFADMSLRERPTTADFLSTIKEQSNHLDANKRSIQSVFTSSPKSRHSDLGLGGRDRPSLCFPLEPVVCSLVLMSGGARPRGPPSAHHGSWFGHYGNLQRCLASRTITQAVHLPSPYTNHGNDGWSKSGLVILGRPKVPLVR